MKENACQNATRVSCKLDTQLATLNKSKNHSLKSNLIALDIFVYLTWFLSTYTPSFSLGKCV